MIDHPIFKNRVLGIGYLSLWSFILIVNTGLDYYYGRAEFGEVIITNTIFCGVFALLSIPLWYNVGDCMRQRGWWLLIFNHLATASIFIIVWYSISYYVVVSLLPEGKVAHMPKDHLVSFAIFSGLMGYTIVILSYYLHMYSRDLRSKHENELLLQRSLKEVEISMLRSQINPHFLFNSLNSISSLTMIDAERAQEMVIKLSDYLRYTVSQEKSVFVTLRKEIENLNRYLDIEKVRFGSKLLYVFNVEELAYDAEIPVMILQPLYENAIKHGVYESTEPITIETKAVMDEDVLVVSIKNNYQEGVPMGKGAGIGLRNIAERLKLIYQNDRLLHIKNESSTFEVTLIIPPVKKEQA